MLSGVGELFWKFSKLQGVGDIEAAGRKSSETGDGRVQDIQKKCPGNKGPSGLALL